MEDEDGGEWMVAVAGNGSNSKWMVRGTVWEAGGYECETPKRMSMCYVLCGCNYANFYPDNPKNLSPHQLFYSLINNNDLIQIYHTKSERETTTLVLNIHIPFHRYLNPDLFLFHLFSTSYIFMQHVLAAFSFSNIIFNFFF